MKYPKVYTYQAPLSNISPETCNEMLQHDRNVTKIAESNSVSRKHLYKQMHKYEDNVIDMFDDGNNDNGSNVMYYLPVTPEWLASFVLSLMFDCKGSFRGIQKAAHSLLDFNLTHDFIAETCREAKKKATELNKKYDLSSIADAALDELFHLGKPVLGGIDLKSLYCFSLSKEGDREGKTWVSTLEIAKQMGLNPERVIADGGAGITYAVARVLKDTKLYRDVFHNIMDMNEMRRFLYNKTKSTKTAVKTIIKRINNPRKKAKRKELQALLKKTEQQTQLYKYLFETISILIEWMRFDILQKPGYAPAVRQDLYDFIVSELYKLEKLHPHRIRKVCRSLKKNKNKILGFLEVLDDKFSDIAEEFGCSIDVIWQICHMQKYSTQGKKYLRSKLCMYLRLGTKLPAIEQSVNAAIDSTETSSSMIENFNSRLSGYFFLRKGLDNEYLGLLQFYLNHNSFVRSERSFRKGKSPVNILTGEYHQHWLELLGYSLFKQAA